MTTLYSTRSAFGAPGHEPRWTRASKDGVGTAYSACSRVWFTLCGGIINEVYYPTIDRPQIRDLQFLVTDGETFLHEERRHMESTVEYLSHHALGFRVISVDPEGRYRLIKEVLSDPHQACVLMRTRVETVDSALASRLRIFVLLAPHLEVGGWGNNGHVADVNGREIMVAHKGNTWLALGASIPFRRCSCGYVGTSDGWTDLAGNLKMDWEFDHATNGNIALTAELDLQQGLEFTIGLAFGDGIHHAVTSLFQSLGIPFAEHRQRFLDQWQRAAGKLLPLERVTGDGGNLYHTGHGLLLAHEDKTYPGALIASLSIPWGEARGDDELGGYHLVWARDMVNSATGLLACGNAVTPLRSLIYLACAQLPDGGFHQNFWVNGEGYWRAVQLDEVAYPVLLAWHLDNAGMLREFDPYPMVLRAAQYLIHHGPATPQERWEENSGYSPSTLATNIAALICAAGFARRRGDQTTARYLEEYADFLECHVERWTVTNQGVLLSDVPRHYIRILPADANDAWAEENPDHAMVTIRNRAPGLVDTFAAREIVDAGFLELVRYGIRRPDDPLVADSLRVVDAVLKVDTPYGPCWRRYNYDGYGQRDDGLPYQGWGRGRAWPLLTGERGHYELAAGRGAQEYIRAMERFATGTGLLSEQIWDERVRKRGMLPGRPTGAAMPLLWAHAEYIKLVRSVHDGQVFDLIPAVRDRYWTRRNTRLMEIWKFNRQVRTVQPGYTLRIQAAAPFELRWTGDDWLHSHQTASTPTGIGIDYVDISIDPARQAPIRFTFFWPAAGRWEERDFTVAVARG